MSTKYPMKRRILKNGQEEHNPDLRAGDYVTCVERGISNELKEGQIYKVESIQNYHDIKVYGVLMSWSTPAYMLAIKDNKLNRVLYPELVPENGYLRAKK